MQYIMKRINRILDRDTRLIVGLMSGTSVDGIDAALVELKGSGLDTRAELICFKNYSYDDSIRERIFRLFDPKTSRVDEICHMNFLLGELFADAALKIIAEGGYTPKDIDIIGSHGQTIYHMPEPIEDSGYNISSTLQIGEPSIIAERTGVVTVGDFRVRDMAAGGQGAPLVPYSEYILYREKDSTVALQNIGGISNVTVIPADCNIDEVFAFDNGPGNMVIDEVVRRITDGKKSYDEGGHMASQGTVDERLLAYLMDDEYFRLSPPKTTGREYFGSQYVDNVMEKASKWEVDSLDLIATVTALTAKSIAQSYKDFILNEQKLEKIIVGGGGSYNKTLINMLRLYLQGQDINVLTQEDIGLSSDAKEAIAFAILANETINGNANNVPNVTGAKNSVVMGKICI